MITLQSSVHVNGIGGGPLFDFLINPNDRDYQRWWPGTHLEFHTVRQRPGQVGDVIYMDEYVDKRRVQMSGVVIEAIPGKKITWQMKEWIRLPVWVDVELEEDAQGVMVIHTIKAGFNGMGRLLDGIFRLYLTRQYSPAGV